MVPVPLNLTKVAFQIATIDHLADRIASRASEPGGFFTTTRYLPKRHEEMAGGSLYWILKHQLVARTPIRAFGEAEGGRVAIHLAPELILVQPRVKRAHQGWRYLEHADAPGDLGGGADGLAEMPAALIGRLSELALI